MDSDGAGLHKSQGGVEAVDRAISILKAFRFAEAPVSLTTLCERTGLHKTTVLRLAESLERASMLQRLPDKRYRLGGAVSSLARVFNSIVGLEQVVERPCRSLVEQTELSVSVYERRDDWRVCTYRYDPVDLTWHTLEVGGARPLDATSTGLAFRRYQDVVAGDTDSDPILTMGVYNADRRSMSYPVFGAHNRLAAVLTLSGSVSRFERRPANELADKLIAAARQMEKGLGRFVTGAATELSSSDNASDAIPNETS